MTIVKRFYGFWVILMLVFLSANLPEAEALKLTTHSAILMDMTTGRILYSHNADDAIQPASITKILSLYLADEAIREGRVRSGDPVRISRKAGRTAGSKMFLQAGTVLPVEELIKGVAVVSANDASVALAEYIGGGIDEFVERMNRKARELGMSRSFFRNPNGLPAKGQVTTARDMATLARAYLQRFPESLTIHSMQHYTYRDITQQNRNALLKSYPNADGLKTGWVHQAGYHIVATAKRGDARLIAEAFKETAAPHRLIHLADGAKGLAYLQREEPFRNAAPPALILLDLNLPRIDGREVLAQIKSSAQLRRAARFEAVWESLYPAAPAEAWALPPGGHARAIAMKASLRREFPGLLVDMGDGWPTPNLLHAFHLADLLDARDEARRLIAAMALLAERRHGPRRRLDDMLGGTALAPSQLPRPSLAARTGPWPDPVR